MTEANVLWATCPGCGHRWTPYGMMESTVPLTANITCPKCGKIEVASWLDSETAKKLTQKQLGLLDDAEVTTQIIELTKQIELLQKELELEKTKREVVEGRLELLDDWKNRYQSMFDEIESYYNEDKDFRENNK